MTGAILRRLREHYGITLHQLAVEMYIPDVVPRDIERRSKSYSAAGEGGPTSRNGRNHHREQDWRRYLVALRALKARKAKR